MCVFLRWNVTVSEPAWNVSYVTFRLQAVKLEPPSIYTDILCYNGSPFNSHAFAEFAKYSKMPRWPRANAQAEAFNKPLMKAVRAAVIEKKTLETGTL